MSENKKSFEELADEALDTVAGGERSDYISEFASQFPRNNCDRCMYASTPAVGAMMARLAPSATCPGLAVK